MKFTRQNVTYIMVGMLAVLAVFALLGHPLIPADAMAGLGSLGLVPMAVGEVSLTDINKAIERTNTAFDEFKKVNDERLVKMEKGQGTAELQQKMDNIFTDMAEAKKVIADIEKKLNRPALGSDGKPVDENAELHRKSFDGFVRKGQDFDRTIEQKAMAISSGTDGGYAVPKVIDSKIEALAVNISPIRSLATVQPISTSDYHKLLNLRGTTSGWVGETQARPNTNTPQFADISPPMGELYAQPAVSQQMLDDVFFDAESWLAGEIATEFSRAEGAAHVGGSGVNQPKGFASYATAATGDATRAFGTIEHCATGVSGGFKVLTSTVNPVDDLFTLVSKMKAMYRAGASWVTNKQVLFTIMGFKDYQGRYVFTPTTAPGVSDMILGYPVTEAEDVAAMAANSLSLWFANWKQFYLIVDRVGTRVIRDPYTSKPNVLFYTTKRSGGSCLNTEAGKALKLI